MLTVQNFLLVALLALDVLYGYCTDLDNREADAARLAATHLYQAQLLAEQNSATANSVKSGNAAPAPGNIPGTGREIAAPPVPNPEGVASLLRTTPSGSTEVTAVRPDGTAGTSFSVPASAANLAVSPDGTQIGVTAGPSVSIYNPSGTGVASGNLTGAAGPVAPQGGLVARDISPAPVPGGMAIMPDNSGAYVSDSANGLFYWFGFATRSATAYTNPATPAGSGIPGILPNGSQVWIPNTRANSITVIDTATNTLVTTITGVPSPTQVAFLQDGTRAAVLSSPASGNGAMYAVNPATYGVLGSASVGISPKSLAVVPYTTTVWTANSGSGTMTRVDVGPARPVALETARTGTTPVGVAALTTYSR